jgi:hypothetical protein
MDDINVKLIIERIMSLETLLRQELDGINKQLDVMYSDQQSIRECNIRLDNRLGNLEEGHKERGARLGQLEKDFAVHMATFNTNRHITKGVGDWVKWVVVAVLSIAGFVVGLVTKLK